jgi:hypothetical protein
MGKKIDKTDEKYFAVKMTQAEMLKVLQCLLGREASYEELKNYGRNVGGLAYHLVECYENANTNK